MMDRSALFNNAGADIMDRRKDCSNLYVAMDLFLGALESKLSYERLQEPRTPESLDSDASASKERLTRAAEVRPLPSSVLQAEAHLQNLEVLLTPTTGVASSDPHSQESTYHQSTMVTSGTELPSVNDTPVSLVVPIQCRGYNPFIYSKSFHFSEGPRTGSMATAQLHSSFIVFNLGLVHQLVDRTSPKASSFYEISAALVTSSSANECPEADLLCLALYNNYGVWCFENGYGDCMRECMDLLSAAIQKEQDESSTSARLQLDDNDLVAMRTNIQWLLTPPNGGSPAA